MKKKARSDFRNTNYISLCNNNMFSAVKKNKLILLIQSDLEWCIHLSKSLFLYLDQTRPYTLKHIFIVYSKTNTKELKQCHCGTNKI